MLPCKGGGKGPELDTFEKSLDEVSFDDAFIEIKSQNIEFVTKRVRLNLRMVAKLQTDTAPEATKSRHAYDMATYTMPKRKYGILISGERWGLMQGGIAAE
jgi:exoribonuclease II